jgi:hypothetical protein
MRMRNCHKNNLSIIGKIMGPLAKFILALTNLVRSGGVRNIPQAIKFAEQQFGKVTPLLKKQIEKVFESAKKPTIGKPGKKEGTVLPFIKETGKEPKGLETLDVSEFDEFNLSKDDPMGDLEKIVKGEGDTGLPKDPPKLDSRENIMGAIDKLKNPRRAGGPLDPVEGLTRTLARRILDRKGIEIGKNDPIDVFDETFGEIIVDVKDLAEEMIEADAMGRNLKSPDELLEIEGLFDIEIPTNPRRGVPVEETIKRLEQDLEQKNILEDFDPSDREPNAVGGLAGILKL